MNRFNRRSLLGVSLLGAGAALMGRPALAAGAGGWSPYANNGPEDWVIDSTSAVADTDSGKVMGYIRGDVRIFMGIPYAEVLSPEGRFMRGAKVRPWTGKRSSRAQGPSSPPATTPTQVAAIQNGANLDEVYLREMDNQTYRVSEDCLRINVWTPGLDSRKRPVLFWCHGGSFQNGFGLTAARLEAHNLARYGDVVVVSINHRLNVLGFLDLTAYGARYAESANLGMLDIVDALKWVRINIANFGGDPNQVMIFGQSGGGGKVGALLAMPEAKGLFNRAVMQSPGPMPFATPEQSAARTASFLKLVNVSPANIDALHKMPLETLMAGATTITTAAMAVRERFDLMNTFNDWRPTVDGRTLLYDPTLPKAVSDVPLMIGNNLHENYIALDHPEYVEMTEARARELVRGFYGPISDNIYDIYKRAFPNAIPYEVSSAARATGRFRGSCVKISQRRAALGGAPTYNYWFQWRASTFDGRAMAHHELEVPLVYLNVDAVPWFTGGNARARALSLKMADAWLAFARTGDPNTGALPAWSPVTPNGMTSMVFDDTCRIDHGSDLAAIEMYWKSRFPTG